MNERILSIPLATLPARLQGCRVEMLCLHHLECWGRVRDDSYTQQYWISYASPEHGCLAPERVCREVPSGRGDGKEPGLDIRGWELTRSLLSVLSLLNPLPDNSLSLDSGRYAGRSVACSPRGLCAASPARVFAGHWAPADAYPTCKIVISIHVGQAGVQIGNACCKPPTPKSFISLILPLQGNSIPSNTA